MEDAKVIDRDKKGILRSKKSNSFHCLGNSEIDPYQLGLNDKMLRTAVREIRTRDKAIELKFEEETTKKASAKSMKVTEEKEDRVLVEINKKRKVICRKGEDLPCFQ